MFPHHNCVPVSRCPGPHCAPHKQLTSTDRGYSVSSFEVAGGRRLLPWSAQLATRTLERIRAHSIGETVFQRSGKARAVQESYRDGKQKRNGCRWCADYMDAGDYSKPGVEERKRLFVSMERGKREVQVAGD